MRSALAMMCLLAGCPRPGGPGGGATGGGAASGDDGVGCPAADQVYVASFVSAEGGAGRAGWVLPLHDQVVDTLDGVPEYQTIDAAAATAAGVPAAPRSVWLLGGRAPCRATIGAAYAAAIDAPTPNVTYGVELAGCPAPPDPQVASAIVVASERPPTGCQLVAPRAVAQRLGEIDDKGTWSRPTRETPIPPALASALPTRACAPPACEPLWSIAQVDVAGKPVAWAGAINWLAIPDGATPDQQCSWQAERFSGFFVAGPGGAPVRVTDGQDHPLALTAVLADRGGAKVLIAEGPGEYSTYDLAAGAATVGRHLVWLRPHPDSYEAVDHLGPPCN